MGTVYANLKQSHMENEGVNFPDVSCTACADLKHCIYATYSNIEKGAASGCSLCALLQQGLMKFEVEIKRLEDPSTLIDIEVAEGQPVRVTTQHFFDTEAEASDPPIYEFFTTAGQESPYPSISSSIDFNDSPLSARWHKTAVAWIRECATSHTRCKRFGTVELPRRVLDITGNVSLQETDRARGIYICLSYCWGQGLNLCTTSANLEQMKSGIRWSTIPKTLRHAIMIARIMNVGYIWIDSLCIIQDDKEDWERESSRMASIYQNAFLTIAATSSENTDHGCFGDPEPRVKEVYEVPALNSEGSPTVFVRRALGHQLFHQMHQSNYRSAPLLGRAWAFQEHLLSTRVLQFTFSELVWECNEQQRCECGGVSSQGEEIKQVYSLALQENTIKSLSTLWSVIIQKYTSLNITHDSDRLPALSGIAKQFEQLGTLGKYHAGLWEKDFVRGLLWFNPRSMQGPRKRPKTYCAPTWSWASVVGTSHLCLHLLEGIPTARVLDIYTEPSGDDPTGAFKEGACVLASIFLDANVTSYVEPASDLDDDTKPPQLKYRLHCGSKEPWNFVPDVHLFDTEQLGLEDFKLDVKLLIMGREPNDEIRVCFLVLKSIQHENPIYERIGMTTLIEKRLESHINVEDFQGGEFGIL